MTDGQLEVEEICRRLGFTETPEVLEAAETPLRRGHHVALLAGEGSGKASVVALAAAETCDPELESLQALVLVPEAAHAWRLAAAVQRVVGPEGLVVACPTAVPEDDRPADAARAERVAHVLVGRPSMLLPDIRAGRHSISGLRLLVLDRVADLMALEEWGSVEPILETLPKDARKVAISDREDPGFTALVDRQLPRARRWPEALLPVAVAPVDEDDSASDGGAPPVRCALVPRGDFIEALERCVRDADRLGCARIDLAFRTPADAARAAAELAVAGLDAGVGTDESTVAVALPGEGERAVARVGLPFRLETLRRTFEGDGPRYAVAEPRHAAQLHLLLARLGRTVRPLPGQLLHEELDPVHRYRMRIREAVEATDLMSELLILEPLFEELGAVRVAAALSELLRARGQGDGAPVRPWADVEAASSRSGASPGDRGRRGDRTSEVPRGARPAWTRLYFGIGRRDEAKPGDIVGAITGETGIAGAQVGKIEIMGNFSLVDIDSQVADDVMRKLDGVTIRGRTVPVRRDRES
ncbi:MAG: DbpA RNA binding domain-containing protein [Gemmatimonadales bacterium]|jgi:ATP-dependent RNA helicase DeaD